MYDQKNSIFSNTRDTMLSNPGRVLDDSMVI